MTARNTLLHCVLILTLLACGSRALIIPEELPSLLSIIYSNIPPIKNGFDSRFGIGFRLGQHADVQLLTEIGPQIETEPLGEPERRRSAAAPPNYVYESKSKSTRPKIQQHEEEEEDAAPPAPNSWLAKWHRSATQNLMRPSSLAEDSKVKESMDEPVMSHLSKLYKKQ